LAEFCEFCFNGGKQFPYFGSPKNDQTYAVKPKVFAPAIVDSYYFS